MKYGWLGSLRAFEIKYATASKTKTPSAFRQAYPETEVKVINKENYLEFIL
jgi:hypothetical protein